MTDPDSDRSEEPGQEPVDGMDAVHRFRVHEDTFAADSLQAGFTGYPFGLGEVSAALKPDASDPAGDGVTDYIDSFLRSHDDDGGIDVAADIAEAGQGSIGIDGIGPGVDRNDGDTFRLEGAVDGIAELAFVVGSTDDGDAGVIKELLGFDTHGRDFRYREVRVSIA